MCTRPDKGSILMHKLTHDPTIRNRRSNDLVQFPINRDFWKNECCFCYLIFYSLCFIFFYAPLDIAFTLQLSGAELIFSSFLFDIKRTLFSLSHSLARIHPNCCLLFVRNAHSMSERDRKRSHAKWKNRQTDRPKRDGLEQSKIKFEIWH